MPARETPTERLDRLFDALEQLTSQESFLISADELGEALRIQQRILVITDTLPALTDKLRKAGQFSPRLEARLRHLVAAQHSTSALLAARRTALENSLSESLTMQRRASTLRPVYGRAPASPHRPGTHSQLNTSG